MNTSQNVIMNMIDMGMINENSNIPVIFESYNKDFYIEMIRKELKLWNENSNIMYNCKMIFKNNIGNVLFELNMSEIDMIRFEDICLTYQDFNMLDSQFTVNINSPNEFGYYVISWKKEVDNNDTFGYIDYLTISQYNSQIGVLIPRIRIAFDQNKFYEFTDDIFYTFLSDIGIDDTLYIREIGNFY